MVWSRIFTMGALAVLAGCTPDATDAAPDQPRATATAQPSATASASATSAGGASKVEENTDLYEFSYAWPAAAGAIPALRAKLEADRAERKAELVADATSARADAKENGFPYHPHSFSADWQKVAEIPGWLSLTNSFSTFSGGAHGNYGTRGLLWDKAADAEVKPQALFTSPAAFKAAVDKPFCDGLNAARRKKGMGVPSADDPIWPRCLDPFEDVAVILGSTTGKAFDRIGFLADPYVAGSYVEGSYEVTIPVTPAILAAVKPQYRDIFAAR